MYKVQYTLHHFKSCMIRAGTTSTVHAFSRIVQSGYPVCRPSTFYATNVV